MRDELVQESAVLVHGAGKMYKTDVNECASMPCLSNGTCIDDINGFTCVCTSGFSGSFCETSTFVLSQ